MEILFRWKCSEERFQGFKFQSFQHCVQQVVDAGFGRQQRRHHDQGAQLREFRLGDARRVVGAFFTQLE